MTLVLIIKVPTPADQHSRNHAPDLIVADPSWWPCAPGRRYRSRQARRPGLRNLALSILRINGIINIAQALRHHA